MQNDMETRPAIVVIEENVLLRSLLLDSLSAKLEDADVHAAGTIGEAAGTLKPVAVRLVVLRALPQPDATCRDIATIRETFRGAAIMLLCDTESCDFARRVLMEGCSGVLSTSAPLEIAVAAVRLVLAGGTYCPYPLQHDTADRVDAVPPPAASPDTVTAGEHVAEMADPNSGLTARERLVLDQLSRGHPNKIIARSLNISESTAKMHVRRILAKLGARNRTEAAILHRARPDP